MVEESWPMDVQGVDEQVAPRVFVSYSWDSEQHQTWVLGLAHRLRTDGVDMVLDQWDTRLGSDLALFMESAANLEYRVLAIVTENYVAKSNIPQGGVGYERRVITPTLMNDLFGHRVVPVLRSGCSLPIFMGANATKYIDFRTDDVYEEKYVALLRDLHGMPVPAKPPLGPNPFSRSAAEDVDAVVRESHARYVSPAAAGEFEFDYENNNGRYVLGTGDTEFTVSFSAAGPGSIYAYTDGTNLKSLALVPRVSGPEGVGDASVYDGSSRVRHPQTGDAIVLRNAHDYWAAVFIDEVLTRHTSPLGRASIKARYVIQGTRSRHFGPITSE